MTEGWISGVGLLGPGLVGWPDSQPVLRREVEPNMQNMPRPVAEILPPNERRRAGAAIKLALYVANEAVTASGVNPETLPSVFSSCHGDIQIAQKSCLSLTAENPFVSPTLFHNSVHNAPSGYWHIATGSRQPSNSISGGNDSFAMGLVEALAMLGRVPAIMMTCSDIALPDSFQPFDPVTVDFGMALVLTRGKTDSSIGQISLAPGNSLCRTKCVNTSLVSLAAANPAARSLILLEAMAFSHQADVFLTKNISASYAPC